MTSIVIIFLIIAQCLSFYFIVLLNVKISRLKDVEEKQQRLKDDMDDAVGAYLAEMKDENDRLIAELKKAKVEAAPAAVTVDAPVAQPQQSVTVVRPKQAPPVETQVDEEDVQQLEVQELLKKDFTTPIAYAKNAYQKQRPTPPPLTMEEQAKQMYKQGHSIDEIAKTLNRGKTEIELLLKFQQ